MTYKFIEAEYSYRCADKERGREEVSISVNRDGSRVVRCLSEIYEDKLIRDVTLSLAADFSPLACFVHLTIDHRPSGHGWFRFGERQLECEMWSPVEGRISQRVDVPRRVRSFGTHPIFCDGLHTAMFDESGEKLQRFENIFLSSYAFNGASGPLLLPISFGIEHINDELCDSPVGQLPCRQFRFVLGGELGWHPDERVWLSTDGDHVLVRMTVGDPKSYDYELVSFRRRISPNPLVLRDK